MVRDETGWGWMGWDLNQQDDTARDGMGRHGTGCAVSSVSVHISGFEFRLRTDEHPLHSHPS